MYDYDVSLCLRVRLGTWNGLKYWYFSFLWNTWPRGSGKWVGRLLGVLARRRMWRGREGGYGPIVWGAMRGMEGV